MRPFFLLVLVFAASCTSGGGGSGGGRAGAGAGPGPRPGAGGSPAPPAVDFARLESDMQRRRADYLVAAATGSGNLAGHGESIYTQIARLETGIGPVSRAAFELTMDRMDRREDTADFGANALLRIIYLHGTNPMIPLDLRQRAERTFLAFKYWVDEPGRDEMVYWSENHQILFATAEYLAGHLYPAQVFSNAGMTGAAHAAKARPRIFRWLDHRMRFGFSEWYSPVYYEEDIGPLFNLADFAPDPDIRDRAAIVLDLLIFDLARLTHRGSFGVTAGRAYEEHKWSGRGQSVGDLVEILFGTRGEWRSRGSFAAVSFASSRGYRVPHALLGIGRDAPARSIERARSGISFGEGPSLGIGFQTLEDGMFWWGMGAYMAPETIVLTRRMINAWDLWHYSYFQPLATLNAVSDALLPGLASALSPLTEGSVLSTANTITFRTPDAMLSSVQSFRRGQIGFQTHAWQATLDLDAVVFTTAPGNLGHDGPTEWTGSGSMPRVVQVEDALVALYNPAAGVKALFPRLTHAFFPRAAFDEVVDAGAWTFARKGDGYVALYTALPAYWQTGGPFAGRELVAPGERNVWICQVGRRAEDGSFAAFCAAVAAAPLAVVGAGNAPQSDPLAVRYDAPGIGPIEVDWSGTPAVAGAPIAPGPFPRFDSPYAQVAFGQRSYTIAYAGAALAHDLDLGVRAGNGL